jgi:RHS repeat-associated protein
LVPTGAAFYAYNAAGQTIGEYNADLSPVAETIYLGKTPVAVLKQQGSAAASTIQLLVGNAYADQTNTARVIARNSDEAVIWRWDTTEAFGNSTPQSNPSGLGPFVYNQRMPGQVYDAEIQDFYNVNRNYQPSSGRYIQPDPIGLKGGLNPYVYSYNTPTLLTDPTGLSVDWTGTVLAVGVVAGGGGQVLRFNLTSECKCHKKINIVGFASMLSLGVGVRTPIPGLRDVAGSRGNVELTSERSECPDDSDANGPATQSGVNVVPGAGFSAFGNLVLGHLRSGPIWIDGPVFGFDLSATWSAGWSAVTSSRSTCC